MCVCRKSTPSAVRCSFRVIFWTRGILSDPGSSRYLPLELCWWEKWGSVELKPAECSKYPVNQSGDGDGGVEWPAGLESVYVASSWREQHIKQSPPARCLSCRVGVRSSLSSRNNVVTTVFKWPPSASGSGGSSSSSALLQVALVNRRSLQAATIAPHQRTILAANYCAGGSFAGNTAVGECDDQIPYAEWCCCCCCCRLRRRSYTRCPIKTAAARLRSNRSTRNKRSAN